MMTLRRFSSFSEKTGLAGVPSSFLVGLAETAGVPGVEDILTLEYEMCCDAFACEAAGRS